MLIYLAFEWRCCICINSAMPGLGDCGMCSVWLMLHPRTIGAEMGTESQHERPRPWGSLAVPRSPDGPQQSLASASSG